MKFPVLAFAAALLPASPAQAADVTFASGTSQVALIELYTSEGCSSCPPAEKWLGTLHEQPGLWRDFVPVAFHVSYWDHLGWKDPLANQAFTEREHAYARAWGAASVYTPCFVRNGAEWRPRNGEPGTARETVAREAGGLKLIWSADHTCHIEYALPEAGSRPRALEIYVALLGGGITTNVSAGENRGRELHHEFVALRLESAVLRRGETGVWRATMKLPPRNDIKASRRAIAAWVTARGELTPLQATGGWLP